MNERYWIIREIQSTDTDTDDMQFLEYNDTRYQLISTETNKEQLEELKKMCSTCRIALLKCSSYTIDKILDE